MLEIIKSMFIVLLTNMVNSCNHTKFVSLSNQKWECQSNLINLHCNEYSHELYHYPFAFNLDRSVLEIV